MRWCAGPSARGTWCRDIRGELKLAGLPEDQWKAVAALAKGALNYRQGRYYAVAAVSPKLHEQQEQQRRIEKAVRRLIKAYRDSGKEQERRGQARVDYVQPVRVQTDDGKSFSLLSRDISPTGIRLVGARRLLGHKVRIFLPEGEDQSCQLLVRILWTCALGEDLFENGGTFLELVGDS
ncbi:MAG: PilZ domain-containing protein [Gemmataceae bacterium]